METFCQDNSQVQRVRVHLCFCNKRHFVMQPGMSGSKGLLHSKRQRTTQENSCRVLLCSRAGQLTVYLPTERGVLGDELGK